MASALRPPRNAASPAPPTQRGDANRTLNEAVHILTSQHYLLPDSRPDKADCGLILEQMIANCMQLKTNAERQNLKNGILAVATVLRAQHVMGTVEIAKELMVEMKNEIKEQVRESLEEDYVKGAHDQINTLFGYTEERTKDMCDLLTQQVRQAVEPLANIQPPTLEEGEIPLGRPSYADMARRTAQYPTAEIMAHDRAIEQTDTLQNQLVIRSNPKLTFDSLKELGPEEIVALVNTALETLLDDPTADMPPTIMISGAKRTRGGAIILQPNSSESGAWLRRPATLTLLNSALVRAVVRPVTLDVMVKFVPVTTNIDDELFLRKIENENGLQPHDIYSACWTKKVERRHEKQKVAFLTLGFTNAKAANRFLAKGRACINKEMLQTQRPTTEPKRCLKCQQLDSAHVAATCTAKDDVCGRCAGAHRTNDCKAPAFRCSNCRADGHAATSRDCPAFREKINQIQKRNPYTNYSLFPTEDPRTWRTIGAATVTKRGNDLDTDNYIPIQQNRRGKRNKHRTRHAASRRPPSNGNNNANQLTDNQENAWLHTGGPTNKQLFAVASSIPMPDSQASSDTEPRPGRWTEDAGLPLLSDSEPSSYTTAPSSTQQNPSSTHHNSS